MLTNATASLSGLRPLPAGLIISSPAFQAKLQKRCRQRRQSATQAQLGGSGEDNKSVFLKAALGGRNCACMKFEHLTRVVTAA